MRPPRPTSALRAAAAGVLALVAAACAATPKPAAVAPPAPPPPVVAPAPPPPPVRERLRQAVQLLDAGRPAPARELVASALADEPDNAVARSLLRQIDIDPRQLFGERSFAHRIAPGETVSSLAERYLGDRDLFWGLARYNGLERPGDAQVGRVIQIPGAPPHRAPARREGVAAKPGAPGAAVPPPPAGSMRDPARAARLRAEALPLLARGDAARAAALLREALRLDPDSLPIQRDLARAERIGARVR